MACTTDHRELRARKCAGQELGRGERHQCVARSVDDERFLAYGRQAVSNIALQQKLETFAQSRARGELAFFTAGSQLS